MLAALVTVATLLGICAVFAVGLAIPSGAEATLLVRLDLHTLATTADTVVEGEVVKQRIVVENDVPYTLSTLRVTRVHKQPVLKEGRGLCPAHITIRQRGGQMGQYALTIPGDARLVVGGFVVLFLVRTPDRIGTSLDSREPLYLRGMAQGAWDVRAEEGQRWVECQAPWVSVKSSDDAGGRPDDSGNSGNIGTDEGRLPYNVFVRALWAILHPGVPPPKDPPKDGMPPPVKAPGENGSPTPPMPPGGADKVTDESGRNGDSLPPAPPAPETAPAESEKGPQPPVVP